MRIRTILRTMLDFLDGICPAHHVLLSDNVDITPADFGRAEHVRRAIVRCVEQRETYIAENGLDRKFCLPDANWSLDAANDFLVAYRHLRDGDRAVINRLLFWSQCFSGYQLMTLTDAHGLNSVNPIPADFDRWLRDLRPRPDEWVRRWRRATRGIDRRLVFSPPRMLGQIGWDIEGIVVNHDTYVYQERLNLLREAGVLQWLQNLPRPARILEIGGGYGALAYALRHILPSCEYLICDLPECLLFSGLYLTLTTKAEPNLPDLSDPELNFTRKQGIRLLPNYLFQTLQNRDSFDLVINTLSLSEMSEHQIRTYCAGIAKMIGVRGIFFEQNTDNCNIGQLFCKDFIRYYFSFRRAVLSSLRHELAGGPADLWANADISSILES